MLDRINRKIEGLLTDMFITPIEALFGRDKIWSITFRVLLIPYILGTILILFLFPYENFFSIAAASLIVGHSMFLFQKRSFKKQAEKEERKRMLRVTIIIKLREGNPISLEEKEFLENDPECMREYAKQIIKSDYISKPKRNGE